MLTTESFDDKERRPLAGEVLQNGQSKGWLIFCPACRCGHLFDQRWAFNGDVLKPTFTGSMAIRSEKPYCHSTVTNGMIHFHDDSEHALRGQTVPLERFT